MRPGSSSRALPATSGSSTRQSPQRRYLWLNLSQINSPSDAEWFSFRAAPRSNVALPQRHWGEGKRVLRPPAARHHSPRHRPPHGVYTQAPPPPRAGPMTSGTVSPSFPARCSHLLRQRWAAASVAAPGLLSLLPGSAPRIQRVDQTRSCARPGAHLTGCVLLAPEAARLHLSVLTDVLSAAASALSPGLSASYFWSRSLSFPAAGTA